MKTRENRVWKKRSTALLALILAVGAGILSVPAWPGASTARVGFQEAARNSKPGARPPLRNERYAFTLDLPSGWSANDSVFSVEHYRGVIFSVNNGGKATLAVGGDPQELYGGPYNPEVVAAQIPGGTVYIDFAFFEGPGTSPHFGATRTDSFDSALSEFLDSAPRWETSDLTRYDLSFYKWGHAWSIYLYFREPVAEAERKAAFDLLRSLSFPERPIRTEIQAAAVAFEHLPEQVRRSVIESDRGSCALSDPSVRTVSVEKEGSDFHVVLELNQSGETTRPRWTFRILMDGSAVLEGEDH